MKASLAESEGKTESSTVDNTAVETSDKKQNLTSLKTNFEKDQERRPASERLDWDGSGSQMLSWHYEKNLGRYFNNPEEIKPMAATMTLASHVVFWGIVAAMVLLVYGARKEQWVVVLGAYPGSFSFATVLPDRSIQLGYGGMVTALTLWAHLL